MYWNIEGLELGALGDQLINFILYIIIIYNKIKIKFVTRS